MRGLRYLKTMGNYRRPQLTDRLVINDVCGLRSGKVMQSALRIHLCEKDLSIYISFYEEIIFEAGSIACKEEYNTEEEVSNYCEREPISSQ